MRSMSRWRTISSKPNSSRAHAGVVRVLRVRDQDGQVAQVVQHRLGEVALLLEPGDFGPGVLALGDLGAVGVEQQGGVGVDRHGPAHGGVELLVNGRAGEPLLAPQDVGDGHLVVVRDRRQVVGGEAVRLEQHRVLDQGVLEADRAPDGVPEDGLPFARHQQAQHRAVGGRPPGPCAPPRSCPGRGGRTSGAACAPAARGATPPGAPASTSSGRPSRTPAARPRPPGRGAGARTAGRGRPAPRRPGPRPTPGPASAGRRRWPPPPRGRSAPGRCPRCGG